MRCVLVKAWVAAMATSSRPARKMTGQCAENCAAIVGRILELSVGSQNRFLNWWVADFNCRSASAHKPGASAVEVAGDFFPAAESSGRGFICQRCESSSCSSITVRPPSSGWTTHRWWSR